LAKPDGVERRHSERARCSLKAVYRLSDGRTNPAETRDLSEDGILLMVSDEVKKDDVINVEIELGAAAPLKARGRVVHTRKVKTVGGDEKLAGIAFLELSEKQQAAIGRKLWQEILQEATRFGKEK
jgi:c-di-GMP-binding flagellar brake protein YcgR